MAGVKTSWEDLSNLGWHKQQVYNTLNAQRGNTMQGLGDIALNEGFAETWSWYCYNVTKGDPYVVGNSVDNATKTTTVWSYDNRNNSQPFTTRWTETWSTTSTASLTVTRSSSISLTWSVTIGSVAGSDFSISSSNETSSTQSKESTHTLQNDWEITVGAGETLSILRTQLTTNGKSVYNLKYGLNDGGLIATKGNQYNGHYYWGFSANYYLNYPEGTIAFDGLSQSSSFSHEIVRNDGAQRASKSVVKLVKPTTIIKVEDGKKTPIQVAFPAENDTPPKDYQ
ncbi:cytolysin [Guyanagaster necrorhizus]|uniref:Cytolysin n=1 Tax=Guyanagaster necrorhizus TaxID=856835 RepID=A0A9P7VM64_9AGAR|nr:cytolysin [Guyanagaster necrorhizus MCA 3950]KAG7442454.1 cytolysin [Guyanagaster necrorhizus MCA 3950]